MAMVASSSERIYVCYVYKSPSLRLCLLHDVTHGALERVSGPQELEQSNPGPNGPVWGDYPDEVTVNKAGSHSERYWGTLLRASCFAGATKPCSTNTGKKTVRDPYSYIDGPETLAGSSYMAVALGPKRAFLAVLSLVPKMCEVV